MPSLSNLNQQETRMPKSPSSGPVISNVKSKPGLVDFFLPSAVLFTAPDGIRELILRFLLRKPSIQEQRRALPIASGRFFMKSLFFVLVCVCIQRA